MASSSGFYAKGTSDEFLKQKGFDDKWTVKEERKKDVWETVLRGPKKKQLTTAEKKAKAAKISEEILKGAPAVRADMDGAMISKLLAKDTKKEDGQEKKEKKEKKEPKSAPQPKAAPAPPKKTRTVPLSARELSGKLTVISAQFEGAPDVMLLHAAQVFEEAYLAPAGGLDYDWSKDTELGTLPSDWLAAPANFLPQDTRDVAVEWLAKMPPSELLTFFDFLVGSALPGGGLNGRGGDKPYVGLKALLQLMLQRVPGPGKSSWHEQGLRLGRAVLAAEGRVATVASYAVQWMLVQLSVANPLQALSSWCTHLLPLVTHDRAKGGKVALQCVKVLEFLLSQAEAKPKIDGPIPVPTERLVQILGILHPEAEEGGKEGGKEGGREGGKGGGAPNKEALHLFAEQWPRLVRVSPIGLQASTCAKASLSPLLSLAANPVLEEKALALVMRVLMQDVNGFEAWFACFKENLKGSLQLLLLLNSKRTSAFPPSLLKKGMLRLEREVSEMISVIAASSDNSNLSEAAQTARRAKAKKKNEKAELLSEVLEQAQLLRSRYESSRRTACLSFLLLLLLLLFSSATALSLLQPECWKQVEPIALLAKDGKLAETPKLEAAFRGCAEIFHQRTEPVVLEAKAFVFRLVDSVFKIVSPKP